MSDKQRRYLCEECKREWIEPTYCYANSSRITITGNPPNSANCPVCGSQYIQLIEFKPKFPGLDIPRDQINKTIPIKTIETIPGINSHQSFSIRAEVPSDDQIPFPQIKPEDVSKDIEESIVNWTQLI